MQSMIEAHGVGRRSSAWGSDDLSRRVWFGYWHAPLDFKKFWRITYLFDSTDWQRQRYTSVKPSLNLLNVYFAYIFVHLRLYDISINRL